MIIVLEGIDGCGKDTQIELLKKEENFEFFKYPTKRFGLLRDYLEKKVELEPRASFLLFLADIANEQKEVERAENAILDRYVYSTIAYKLDEISFEKAKETVEKVGFIKPDLVILLDLEPEIALERKAKQKTLDRNEENLKYQKGVRENFLRMYKENFHAKRWELIDASKPVGEVYEQIKKAFL
ncbi:dTMP kinase [Candidatus Micrarchaeota archaeon]|nr:dTMP kinase [Candidatus Micrarchaeota archaeon]